MLHPINDKIILRSEKSPDKTDGGIILPDSARKQSKTATVVAVGRGRVLESGGIVEPLVKAGDKVIYVGGEPLKQEGEDLIILSEADILAIVE